MAFELRPLERERLSRIAACQREAFSDYPLPAALDEVGLGVYLRETDVSLRSSWGAYDRDELIGFCLGAVRGDLGSIRGEGTVVGRRRQGIGAAVLERTLQSLREAGAGRVVLEVLEENAAAVALYRREGFEVCRRLLGWSLRRPAPRRADQASPLAPVEAARRLRAWGWPDAPWQLRPETLAHLPAYALGDETVAVAKLRGRRLWLYALAVAPEARGHGHGTALMRALPTARIGIPALIPEDWAGAAAFLRSVGASPDRHAQWEMQRRT